MKVTMQKIADAVGVSRGTVDRALHHRGRISPEVEARIFDAARTMGYALPETDQEDPAAGGSKEIRIGVVTYLCNAGFMREINRGIAQASEELAERGVRVILKESRAVDEKEQLKFLEELDQMNLDGLAVMPIDTGAIRKKLYELSEEPLPLVMFNSKLSGIPRLCYVGMDNFQSGRAAAGLMNMLTGGKGRILVIASSEGTLELANHTRMSTGFFLNELAVPTEYLAQKGWEIVLATPEGKDPIMDQGSNDKKFFQDKETERARAEAFVNGLFNQVFPSQSPAQVHDKPGAFDGVAGIELAAIEAVHQFAVLAQCLDDESQFRAVEDVEHLVQAGVDGFLEERGFQQLFYLERHVAENHRQVERLEGAAAGHGLVPAAFGVIDLGEYDVEGALGKAIAIATLEP